MRRGICWYRRPLCGLDFETTGTNPEVDRPVSASVVRWGGGLPTESTSWLIDPGVEIPAEATAVHGITTVAARSAGRPAADAIAEITERLVEAARQGWAIVVMNAPFDLTLLDREQARHGVTRLFAQTRPLVVDPRVLDKRVDRTRRGPRRLEDLCRHYVVTLEGAAHRADTDAKAACAVTWKIANRHRWLGCMPLENLHAAQIEWAREQAEGLRHHFERTPGKEALAPGVRTDWPLVPAPQAGPGLPSAPVAGEPW